MRTRDSWPRVWRMYRIGCWVCASLLAVAAGMAWQAASWEMGFGVFIVALLVFLSDVELRQRARDAGLDI